MKLAAFYRNLLGLLIIGCIAISVFPNIDKSINPASHSPGIITFAGVGITLILMTARVLYVGLRSTLSLPKQFFVYAILYNALIILAKFVISPATIYDINRHGVFYNGIFQGDLFDLLPTGIIIFLLYFVVFVILYFFYKAGADKLLHTKKIVHTKLKITKSIMKGYARSTFIMSVGLLVVAIFLVLTGIWVIPFLGIMDTFQYIGYFFSPEYGVGGILIAMSIIGSILFLSNTLQEVSNQAVFLKKAALFGTFFWVAVSLLFIFHALWVVYFLIVINIWPLHVVVAK